MKHVLFLSLFSLILIHCQTDNQSKNEQVFEFGEYSIKNAKGRWFVHFDLSRWYEYNMSRDYYNEYYINWLDTNSAILVFNKTSADSRQDVAFRRGDEIQMEISQRRPGIIDIVKDYKGQKRAALLERSNRHIFRDKIIAGMQETSTAKHKAAGNYDLDKESVQMFSALPPQINQNILLFFQTILERDFNRANSLFSETLAQKMDASATSVFINDLYRTLGDINYYAAIGVGQKSNGIFTVDFEVSTNLTTVPYVFTLRFNEAAALEGLALQVNREHELPAATRFFNLFAAEVEQHKYRQVYLRTSPEIQESYTETEVMEWLNSMAGIGQWDKYRLAALEFDPVAYGNYWVYYFKFEDRNTWSSVTLHQPIGKIDYELKEIRYLN